MEISFKIVICLVYIGLFGMAKTSDLNKDFYLGKFEGSGRACYGKLEVKPKSVSWNITFSKCKASAYKILKIDQSGPRWEVVFERKLKDKKCFYPVLRLAHQIEKDPNIGWNVEGFATVKAHQEESVKDSISCYLYRL